MRLKTILLPFLSISNNNGQRDLNNQTKWNFGTNVNKMLICSSFKNVSDMCNTRQGPELVYVEKNIPHCVRTNKKFTLSHVHYQVQLNSSNNSITQSHFKEPHNLNLWGIKSHNVFHPQSFAELAIYLSIYMNIMPKMASTIQF